MKWFGAGVAAAGCVLAGLLSWLRCWSGMVFPVLPDTPTRRIFERGPRQRRSVLGLEKGGMICAADGFHRWGVILLEASRRRIQLWGLCLCVSQFFSHDVTISCPMLQLQTIGRSRVSTAQHTSLPVVRNQSQPSQPHRPLAPESTHGLPRTPWFAGALPAGNDVVSFPLLRFKSSES